MKTRTWEIPEGGMELAECAYSVSNAIHEVPTGWVVKIMPQSKSDRQRGIFHAMLDEISELTGHTPAEVKSFIKEDYLGYTEKKFGGKWRRVLRSTEELDRGDYSKLIEYVPVWRSENGI